MYPMAGVSGVRGFLDRAWRMIVEERAETMQLAAAVDVVRPGEQPGAWCAAVAAEE
mgnify:CR=1 FL=1